VALEPRNSGFLFDLGRAYEYGRQYSKALATYQSACSVNPEASDAIAGWARMEVFIGNPGRALARVAPLLAKSPDNVDGLLVKGMALRQQGKRGEARLLLERGLRLSPTYGDFMLVLAGIAEAEDRTAEAVAMYDRYLALHPDDTDARDRRTRVAARVPK
jgi:tetratricopeptide (TPR) repeat protein